MLGCVALLCGEVSLLLVLDRACNHSLPFPHAVHAYTAAMRAASEGGQWEAALAIWDDLVNAGCTPTGVRVSMHCWPGWCTHTGVRVSMHCWPGWCTPTGVRVSMHCWPGWCTHTQEECAPARCTHPIGASAHETLVFMSRFPGPAM